MLNARSARFPTIDQLNGEFGRIIEQHFPTFFRRILMQGPGVDIEPRFVRIITNEPHPFGNFAVVADSTSLDQARAAIESLVPLTAPSAIAFPGLPAEDVRAFVIASGYALAETMPAMGVNIDSLAEAALPDGYSLAEATPDDNQAWCDAFAEGFGLPRPVAEACGPRAAARVTSDVSFHYFCIFNDSAMVATSTVFLEGGLAGVYCVSTLPAHRGKGLGAFVTAEPLRQLRSRGFRTALLQATLMGEPVYRRLGFQTFGAVPLYVRMPPGMSMAH